MGIRTRHYDGFNPYDPEVYRDPYPIYSWLRDERPAYHNEELDIWVLSRHADVAAGLRDHTRFSSSYGVLIEPSGWGPDAHKRLSFVAMDPPRHTHVRGLVSRGFTPRRVAELEPHIRRIARGHIETALEQDGLDLISDIAAKVPMDVISELAGVPVADRRRVRELGNLLARRPPGATDIPPESMEAIASLIGYYVELIAERRRAPQDDLISALIAVTAEDEDFGDDDIAAFLTLLVGAGNETTTYLLGNAWYWAWRNPAQRAAAFGGRIAGWIEETLRYDSVAQYMARRLVEDTDLHGVTVPGGACVMLLIGSANRDPRVFPDADSYDLSRDTSSMIAFSTGHHYCLGAALARLEARVVLEEFVARVADYDIDPGAVVRAHAATARGFAALPAMVKAR
ncbi:MAG TPA: cytochrome P450 [Streptosporangiaceae bacterium]|nr:cytochrome P450 [Streptosporangiaceae bacterium]